MQAQKQQVDELSPRFTKEMLRRCTARELLVLTARYGIPAIAKRMGYVDIVEFYEELVNQNVS